MSRSNTTLTDKINLRRLALSDVPHPVVLEVFGGTGEIYDHCYQSIRRGIVFEKNEPRANFLGLQRPHWLVYEGDAIAAIREGVGSHIISVNFVDVDAFGNPFEAIESFFSSPLCQSAFFPITFVVTDGMRQKAKYKTSYQVKCLHDAVVHFGNEAVYPRYLEVCQFVMDGLASSRGYFLKNFRGYYCGKSMTHYVATVSKSG